MHEIDESLAAHHRRLERLLGETAIAARSGDWAMYKARFNALRQGLVEHIAYEECERFPALARTQPAAVTALMAEHAKLRQHFDTLNAAAPEHDPDGCLAELEELACLMREHHAAETGLDSRYASERVPGLFKPGPAALDLRGLQPPEPIVRIFAALERSPDQPLRAILPHEPVPLYALLRDRGFRYAGETRPDGGYELLIERA